MPSKRRAPPADAQRVALETLWHVRDEDVDAAGRLVLGPRHVQLLAPGHHRVPGGGAAGGGDDRVGVVGAQRQRLVEVVGAAGGQQDACCHAFPRGGGGGDGGDELLGRAHAQLLAGAAGAGAAAGRGIDRAGGWRGCPRGEAHAALGRQLESVMEDLLLGRGKERLQGFGLHVALYVRARARACGKPRLRARW